ncbi:beta-defensin 113 [Sturnira hondurensis]|uniref:beta-defensin 113 n=1 Tax=Sturnira hondurensis TaxID=192404 RepID=UPI001879D79A|nr:beta-defensin 113 [Sturnira hondurensis]
MKILCIFLIFVFTASCGPSVSQKKTRERTRKTAESEVECFLVRGVCKTSCNSWEYISTYCNNKPCCVLREYIQPNTKHVTTKHVTTTTAHTHATSNSTTRNNTVL